MASNDSKQKRARQNRAQREAREARTKAAAIPAEERKAKYASGTPAAEPSSKKERASERARRERPVRPGDVPVDLDTLEGGWYSKRVAVPGGRQVLTGMVLTIIITAMTVFVKYPDPHATTEAAKKKLDHTFLEYWGPKGIVLALVPLVAMAVACWFTTSPNRRRVWTVCAFVASIGIVFGIPYAFPVGFLVYAGMRANKIEGPVPGSRAARAVAAREEAAAAAAEADDDE
ncbi:MAG TPA: hypothetical protein VNQ33_01490 [Acidimicrobiales bacterium]|nr:hypothetical protein [Acidimicrobiales bacterium]